MRAEPRREGDPETVQVWLLARAGDPGDMSVGTDEYGVRTEIEALGRTGADESDPVRPTGHDGVERRETAKIQQNR